MKTEEEANNHAYITDARTWVSKWNGQRWAKIPDEEAKKILKEISEHRQSIHWRSPSGRVAEFYRCKRLVFCTQERKATMDEKLLKQIVRLQKQVSKLYDKCDVISIAQDGCQTTEQFFKELVDKGNNYEIVKRWDQINKYPYKANLYYDGVLFFTIGTQEEFEAVGLHIPTA